MPATPMPATCRTWSVLVPVKRTERAKTRLAPSLSSGDHLALARALVLDTVAAATRLLADGPVAHLVVVTDDVWASESMGRLGAVVVPDVPDSGLNPALVYAASLARNRWPSDGVAALGADLPALAPEDLGAALDAAAQQGLRGVPRAFVTDAAGLGTTLLCAAPGADLLPAFGPGSRAAHASSGAVELAGPWPTLRQDVDTLADLRTAALMGVGAAVAEVIAALAESGHDLLLTSQGDTPAQGTVREFGTDRGGEVVLDNGAVVPFVASAVAAPDVRLLRRGQRVILATDNLGRVVRISLPGR